MNKATTLATLPDLHTFGASFAQRLLAARLAPMQGGVLEIEHRGQSTVFGRPGADALHAKITVLDPSLFMRVLLGGALAAGEAFVDGAWVADDLTSVLRLFARDRSLTEGFELGASRLGQALARLYHASRKNTRDGSRRNISEHYDLGNDFFELMLDPTMTYSAGVFEKPSSTMQEASRHKLDMLCRRLELSGTDHLLEIGTGWGSLAIHAATHYGCRVTTTTISREQREFSLARIAALGLTDKITVLDQDYRDLAGRFDKIVSCEMIEAVGREYHATFFAKCAALLAPGGKLALQAITIRDQSFERAAAETDFIKRHIFPGSCIPSATALLSAATDSSDLVLRGYEDITPHYARTLREWRDKLVPQRSRVVARYGERFWRMWLYYLAYCEAGFEEGHIGTAQLLFDNGRKLRGEGHKP
jgi:cyclopropane-fatty-acyl-phospholipid synthase